MFMMMVLCTNHILTKLKAPRHKKASKLKQTQRLRNQKKKMTMGMTTLTQTTNTSS